VRRGKLDATGRLFVVDTGGFSEGVKKFPQIQAALTVSAYMYGSGADAAAPPAAPATPPATPPAATPPASPAPPSPTPSPDTPPTSPSPTAAGATP